MRDHYCETIRVDAGRTCNICHKPIKVIPVDHEPKRARFCMTCREAIERRDPDADTWLGAGRSHGATTGPYVIR
jgi:CRISPR/Cas system-associated protein Cas10 (large subunit of type III CRISPR-Cas system)